jgi:hypothetical protein
MVYIFIVIRNRHCLPAYPRCGLTGIVLIVIARNMVVWLAYTLYVFWLILPYVQVRTFFLSLKFHFYVSGNIDVGSPYSAMLIDEIPIIVLFYCISYTVWFRA